MCNKLSYVFLTINLFWLTIIFYFEKSRLLGSITNADTDFSVLKNNLFSVKIDI